MNALGEGDGPNAAGAECLDAGRCKFACMHAAACTHPVHSAAMRKQVGFTEVLV